VEGSAHAMSMKRSVGGAGERPAASDKLDFDSARKASSLDSNDKRRVPS